MSRPRTLVAFVIGLALGVFVGTVLATWSIYWREPRSRG